MSSGLSWLGESGEFAGEIEKCRAISSAAKSFQFLLARAIVRRKTVGLEQPVAALAESYEGLFEGLTRRQGALRIAP